jgi:hypothetical protein
MVSAQTGALEGLGGSPQGKPSYWLYTFEIKAAFSSGRFAKIYLALYLNSIYLKIYLNTKEDD